MRQNLVLSSTDIGSFNPRICKRCDIKRGRVHDRPFVSIHASVKDATASTSSNRAKETSFNPRICKRCDSKAFLRASGLISFNPRICKRCDSGGVSKLRNIIVSIHASVKDATPHRVRRTFFLRLFQSTHL